MSNELIRYEGGSPILDADTAYRLAAYEATAKEIQEEADRLKAQILAEMERVGCIRLETENLVISYIPEGTRESFDSKALREECPEVYDAYARLTPVKSRILVRIRCGGGE